ncbi:hypothetical protein PGIGA_G00248050 [Pangasianodon gigas]|uniref:Uncharacterized protein n=1 Tax=Pangasianodon gigas TaxID=30993 RepID=A0ACC5WPQ2_PANGG|nr:hypothetical protein [Pangasianodon gigas]
MAEMSLKSSYWEEEPYYARQHLLFSLPYKAKTSFLKHHHPHRQLLQNLPGNPWSTNTINQVEEQKVDEEKEQAKVHQPPVRTKKLPKECLSKNTKPVSPTSYCYLSTAVPILRLYFYETADLSPAFSAVCHVPHCCTKV